MVSEYNENIFSLWLNKRSYLIESPLAKQYTDLLETKQYDKIIEIRKMLTIELKNKYNNSADFYINLYKEKGRILSEAMKNRQTKLYFSYNRFIKKYSHILSL